MSSSPVPLKSLLSAPAKPPPNVLTAFLNNEFQSADSLSKVSRVLKRLGKEREQVEDKLATFTKNLHAHLSYSLKTSKQSLDSLESLSILHDSLVTDISSHLQNIGCDEFGKENVPEVCSKPWMRVKKDFTELRKLEEIKEYLSLAIEVDTLRTACLNLASKAGSTRDALQPFERLMSIRQKLKSPEIMDTSADNAPNLLQYVDSSIAALRKELEERLVQKFETALESIHFPSEPIVKETVTPAFEEKLDAFKTSFEDLILLGHPSTSENEFQPLYPFVIMARHISKRFRYHFEGKRPTNRIDKPEWFFAWVLTCINDHTWFLDEYVQHLLRDTDYYAKFEFIAQLLPFLERKLETVIPRLLNHPHHLSHALSEAMQFDAKLRSKYGYCNRDGSIWMGTIGAVLKRKEWLEQWVEHELQVVTHRYDQMINSPDAWSPLYDDVHNTDESKPTHSADRLVMQLEAISERYKLLPEARHQLLFFHQLQLSLIAKYHSGINESLNAFSNSTRSVLNAIVTSPTPTFRQELSIDEIITKTAKFASSLEYVMSTVEEWGIQPFYLTLFTNLLSVLEDPSFSAPESFILESHDPSEVADFVTDSNDPLASSIFDGCALQYSMLLEKLLKYIITTVFTEFKSLMRGYEKVRVFSLNSLTATSQSIIFGSVSPTSITPQLVEPLTYLAHTLNLLHEILPLSLFVQIFKSIIRSVDSYIYQSIILYNEFNDYGVKQLRFDLIRGVLETAVHQFRSIWEAQPTVNQMDSLTKCLAAMKILEMDEEKVADVLEYSDDEWTSRSIEGGWSPLGKDEFRKILERKI
ncbi:TIP-1 family-domain-containing protein [Paraphysoderma sedebokerense]|nr:TIP-1 family-domain-containing protein [Paraphysoderma sedebokerense]